VVTGSHASSGGALFAAGEVSIAGSRFSENSALWGGGAIRVVQSGSLVIADSTLRANEALFGGAIQAETQITILSSTLSANVAAFGGGLYGGAEIANSTISGNWASHAGGGIDVKAVELFMVTLAGNAAPEGAGIFFRAQPGAGTFVFNTVVADSDGPGCSIAADSQPPDIPGQGAHNVDEDGTCAASAPEFGFSTVADAMLGPLQHHGGPTHTHTFHPASPLLNGGDQTLCDLFAGDGFESDQRGLPRTTGPACDVGAVELQPVESLQILSDDVRIAPIGAALKRTLAASIDEAAAALERGDVGAADSRLVEFVELVRSNRGGAIAETDADRLIQAASNIRVMLAEPPR
jgi:hypothetical protein